MDGQVVKESSKEYRCGDKNRRDETGNNYYKSYSVKEIIEITTDKIIAKDKVGKGKQDFGQVGASEGRSSA